MFRQENAWATYLGVGALVMIAYYISVATDANNLLRVTLYSVVSASSALVVLYGCRWHRPKPLLPWMLLAISEIIYAAADLSFYIRHFLLDLTSFPALSDLLYLSHYFPVVAGLILLIRLRTPRRDLTSLLDASVVAVVAGMLSWIYLIGPLIDTDVPRLAWMASLAYPILDLMMFAVALRLLLGRGRRPVSFVLLSIWLLAILAADSIYVYQQLTETYVAGNFIDAIWLTGNLALGAAALHPTMKQLSQPAPLDVPGPGPMRTAALCAAALIAPAILLVEYFRGVYKDVPVIGGACAVLFILTIVRLVGLVAEQRRLAITDSLTGLRTRRYFEAQLPAAISRAHKSESSVALLIADVDHFKSINDVYGHPAGDRVLIEITQRLRRALRPNDLLARYGGEEFAVLVPGAAADDPSVIAERLRHAVASSPVRLPQHRASDVTISVGTASYPLHGSTPTDLVTTADRALYAAKAHGRNRSVIGSEINLGAVHGDAASLIEYLRYVADAVDSWISGQEHSSAVARWARTIAIELGCSATEIRCAEIGGRLHDVGKVLVPREVWVKSSPLTPEERQLIRRHPEDGYRMARMIPGMGDVATAIRQHHERFDGTGYPDALIGEGIRIEARIITVCDSWAAMLANRPYHSALTEQQAREELIRCRNRQFDPMVVDAFLNLHARGDLDSLGELTSGHSPTTAREVASHDDGQLDHDTQPAKRS